MLHRQTSPTTPSWLGSTSPEGHVIMPKLGNATAKYVMTSPTTLSVADQGFRATLGRATWKLLYVGPRESGRHALTSGRCPDTPLRLDTPRFCSMLWPRDLYLTPLLQTPTMDERDALNSYFHLLSRLYPCGECATEFQALLKRFPPQVRTRHLYSSAILI